MYETGRYVKFHISNGGYTLCLCKSLAEAACTSPLSIHCYCPGPRLLAWPVAFRPIKKLACNKPIELGRLDKTAKNSVKPPSTMGGFIDNMCYYWQRKSYFIYKDRLIKGLLKGIINYYSLFDPPLVSILKWKKRSHGVDFSYNKEC